MATLKVRRNISEAFREKVNQDGPLVRPELGPCWIWTGARVGNRYGQAWDGRNKKHVLAHRLAWELACGEIPVDVEVMHLCDNPPCVRLSHLKLGTHLDNMRDSSAKGRNCHGEKSPGAIMSDDVVLRMRERHRNGESMSALAREFLVDHGTAHRAITGKTWKHVPGAEDRVDPDRFARHIRGEKSTTAKLTEAMVKEIIGRVASGETRRSLAAQFGVSPSAVAMIVSGDRWKHVPRPGAAAEFEP